MKEKKNDEKKEDEDEGKGWRNKLYNLLKSFLEGEERRQTNNRSKSRWRIKIQEKEKGAWEEGGGERRGREGLLNLSRVECKTITPIRWNTDLTD